MKKWLWSSMIAILLLSGCSKSDNSEGTTVSTSLNEASESQIISESISDSSSVETSYHVISEEEALETTVSEIVNLGIIQYKDLDVSDPVQAKAKYFGCSIEDDGTTINFIPAMSATVQNLQLYTSGNGNEDYYNNFLAGAIEISLLTDGKPINIYNTGLGEVIITAVDGIVTYSI